MSSVLEQLKENKESMSVYDETRKLNQERHCVRVMKQKVLPKINYITTIPIVVRQYRNRTIK